MDDIKYGINTIRAVEPLGGIGFVLCCLEDEDSTMNFWDGGANHATCIYGEIDRRLYLQPGGQIRAFCRVVRILVKNFLPNDWTLVVDGISTAIPTIITSKFCGLEIIVLENSPAHAPFLYNELDHLVIQPQGPTVVPRGIGRHNTEIQVNMGGDAP
jgi:hypothetical protein